jgi:hypothetical protein
MSNGRDHVEIPAKRLNEQLLTIAYYAVCIESE